MDTVTPHFLLESLSHIKVRVRTCYVLTINDESYEGEKVLSFRGFSTNRKSFPYVMIKIQ